MPLAARVIDQAVEVQYDNANSGFAATEVQSAIDELNGIVAQGGGANAQGTWLVSGGGVAWVTGYVFDVAPAQYYIMGVAHTSPAAQVTLDAPDGTFDRFDVIAVTDVGTVVVLKGTAGAAPELPDIDPQQYLSLTIIRVDTGTATPPEVTSGTIYAENAGTPAEWTGAASGAAIVLGSSNNPHGGTKCVEGTLVANGVYAEFTGAAPLDVSNKSALVFYVRSKGTWGRKTLVITFRNGATVVGRSVALGQGFFAFDSTNVAGYQTISIPITQFALPAGTLADKVRMAVSGGGASIGWYIDDISLQGGMSDPVTGGITQGQADARYLKQAANLSDLAAAAAARTNLGLGTAATRDVPAGGDAGATEVVLGSDTRLVGTAPKQGVELVLFSGYDPAATGTDAVMLRLPKRGWDGASITYDLLEIALDVAVPGGQPSVRIDQSVNDGAQWALGSSVTLGDGARTGSNTVDLGTIGSGALIRAEILALGTATGWSLRVRAREQ